MKYSKLNEIFGFSELSSGEFSYFSFQLQYQGLYIDDTQSTMDLPYHIIFCALVAFYPIYTYIRYYVAVFILKYCLCFVCTLPHWFTPFLWQRTRNKKNLACWLSIQNYLIRINLNFWNFFSFFHFQIFANEKDHIAKSYTIHTKTFQVFFFFLFSSFTRTGETRRRRRGSIQEAFSHSILCNII